MSTNAEKNLSSQIKIQIKGNPLDNAIANRLIEATVDQHTHLPDMFTIRFTDSDMTLLDGDTFTLGKEIKISGDNEQGDAFILIDGEITALEPSFMPGQIAELVVRGYDKSHRLYRNTHSRTFMNQKDSDIATLIAKEIKLNTKITPTKTIYPHLTQHNQSDLQFLMERAWRIGYECYVSEGVLYFQPPPEKADTASISLGEDLQTFMPRLTAVELVEAVSIHGWDVAKQQAIVGKAQATKGKLYPNVNAKKEANGISTNFGTGHLTIVDQPALNQAEADILAQARLNELSGAYLTADGSAFRRPDIKAGKMLKISGVGKRLSGVYLVTSATHIYNQSGLMTHFTVNGARTGSFAEQMTDERPLTRHPGLVPAIVTNTDDPKDWGRVKLKYPWLDENVESDWARVLGIGSGPDCGFFGLPDIQDEVLVGFEHGDFNRPYVLGGVWNGKHNLPTAAGSAKKSEKPLVRTWQTRLGHQITLYDDSQNKIEIKSKKGLIITLDDSKDSITIQASKEISVKAGTNMSLEAGGNIAIKASGNMDLNASGKVTVKGATINLN